jgi:hypothetical protein
MYMPECCPRPIVATPETTSRNEQINTTEALSRLQALLQELNSILAEHDVAVEVALATWGIELPA